MEACFTAALTGSKGFQDLASEIVINELSCHGLHPHRHNQDQ